MHEGFWVCTKDIDGFKAGAIYNVYEADGDRVVYDELLGIKKSFHWKSTKNNFTYSFGDYIVIPFSYPKKSLANLIRPLFKKSPDLIYAEKRIKIDTDSVTRRKIQTKIMPYILSIDNDILLEFSDMLIRILTNLMELSKHNLSNDIDEEINKIHDIVLEIFNFNQNIFHSMEHKEKQTTEAKLRMFREAYNRELMTSLNFVKMLNDSK